MCVCVCGAGWHYQHTHAVLSTGFILCHLFIPLMASSCPLGPTTPHMDVRALPQCPRFPWSPLATGLCDGFSCLAGAWRLWQLLCS